MVSLSRRDRQPELMDQPGLDPVEHRRALAGLQTTNSLCRTARIILRGIISEHIRPSNDRPLRVLDIAAGGGDVVIGLAKLAASNGINVEAHGCDINNTAVDYAMAAANRAGIPNAKFFRFDALADELPTDYDVLMCTLFLHHLSPTDSVKLLQRMARATKQCVLVDDLRRTRFGYAYAWFGGRLITRSRIVHTDGPLSVRAAFTIEEAQQLARDAGMRNARFRRHWPERFLMSWKKASA